MGPARVRSTREGPDEAPASQTVPLHLLTARQRLVLRILFDDQKTVAEAARVIGVDEQTVRSTKHKALSRLRSHFSATDPDSGGSDEGDGGRPIRV